MTACIPTYRDLWINLFQGRNRSYFQGESGKNSYALKDHSNLSYNKKVRTNIYHHDDDKSDRHILRMGEEFDMEAGHKGIMRTNHVHISIEPESVPRPE